MWGRVRTQEARRVGWVVLTFPSWREETNIFEGREEARRTRRPAAREPASYGGENKGIGTQSLHLSPSLLISRMMAHLV